jgi:DNA-binding GntR family transcriptional regulator
MALESGAAQRVYRGIMLDLEEHRIIPGQRLVETDLAERFAVGRNAVREAIQRLVGRGVVDASPNRSASIRSLDLEQTLEVLDVARVMTGLAAATAARHFRKSEHGALFVQAAAMLESASETDEVGEFSHARRNLYRLILQIGGNRELQRLFPAISMHIIFAQHQTRQLRGIRIADYLAMMDAIERGDPAEAEETGVTHVENVRKVILERHASASARGVHL